MSKIIHVADLRTGPAQYGYGGPFALRPSSGQSILNLCVSDANKLLLLKCDGFIPVLVDSLLLDPDHPIRAQDEEGFEAAAPAVQRVSWPPLLVRVQIHPSDSQRARAGLRRGDTAACCLSAGARGAVAGAECDGRSARGG